MSLQRCKPTDAMQPHGVTLSKATALVGCVTLVLLSCTSSLSKKNVTFNVFQTTPAEPQPNHKLLAKLKRNVNSAGEAPRFFVKAGLSKIWMVRKLGAK
eukprot:1057729-Amphidinium_carterae.1